MRRFPPRPDRRPTLIAGASSGIGAATAVALAASGFPVALAARRVDKCCELVEAIRLKGGEAVAVALDVTNPSSVADCVSRTSDEIGAIDLLVAGAGDTTFGRIHEIDSGRFDEQLQVHLVGANRVATAVLPGMIGRQRGQLIFVGSDVALRQRPHVGAYGAAKAALTAMVTNLQMELEGTGVTASIVHPGPTSTSMGLNAPIESLGPMLEDWSLWGHARHSYTLRAEDVARAIAFVAQSPRGVNVASMLVSPEAPLSSRMRERASVSSGKSGLSGVPPEQQ